MPEKEPEPLEAPQPEPDPNALLEQTQAAVETVREKLPDLVKQIEIDRDFNLAN